MDIEKRGAKYRAKYTDPFGRQRSQTFHRKADAQRFLHEMHVAIDQARWIDPQSEKITVAEWSENFLSLARNLSPSTQWTYRRDLTKYVLPRFGHYRIGRLPADEIENWLNDEIERGLSPSSVHRHYRTFRRMMQVAVEKEKLLQNPCVRVRPPRVPRGEMNFWTWSQAADLAEGIDSRYRALIYLAVDSGMRWGELIGLRRGRLDIASRKVRVTEQLIRMGPSDWLRKEPKTPRSYRSITISPFTAALLADHLEQFSLPGLDGLVFPNSVGNPIINSSFYTHYFKPVLLRNGFTCRFHDLRHTSVALAIASGAHPKAIQSRMGHSSINVTLDRYGHLLPELDEAIATSFGESFLAAQSLRATRDSNVLHASFG